MNMCMVKTDCYLTTDFFDIKITGNI